MAPDTTPGSCPPPIRPASTSPNDEDGGYTAFPLRPRACIGFFVPRRGCAEDLPFAAGGARSGISLAAMGDPSPVQASQPGPAEKAPLLPWVISLNAAAAL